MPMTDLAFSRISERDKMYCIEPTNSRINPHCFLNYKRILPYAHTGACLTSKRVSRLWANRSLYFRLICKGLYKGISPVSLARTQFPFIFPTAAKPPGLHVELTNYCNLRCTYCPSPLNLRPKGWMEEKTFSRLVEQIRAVGIKRVYIIGNGEATLHPLFPEYVRKLAKSTRVISLTSNWQMIDKVILRSILEAPLDILNISLDGKDAQSYENSRLGGSFERLVDNLRALRQFRQQKQNRLMVNIRVLLRPSQASQKREIFHFWREFADNVAFQLVVDENGIDADVYGIDVAEGCFPRCAHTFKQLNVHWDGHVPLCTYATRQADDPQLAYLGNINTHSILQLWNHQLILKYRNAHRKRINEDMPLCNGCIGC